MSTKANKIIYDKQILIDLTQDTVTAKTLKEGVTAHDSSGNTITGTAVVASTPASSDAGKVWTAKNDGTAHWANVESTKVVMKTWTSADIGT